MLQLDGGSSPDGRCHRLAVHRSAGARHRRPARGRHRRLCPARYGQLQRAALAAPPVAPGGHRRTVDPPVGGPTRRLDRWGVGIGIYAALIAGSAKHSPRSSCRCPRSRTISTSCTRTSTCSSRRAAAAGVLQLRYAAGRARRRDSWSRWAGDESGSRLELSCRRRCREPRWFLRSSGGVLIAHRHPDHADRADPRDRGRTGGRRDPADVVLGTYILGLAAMAFAGVGLAVGGVVRSSLAAPVTATLIFATFVLDIVGAALDLPGPDPRAQPVQAPRPADGRRVRPGRRGRRDRPGGRRPGRRRVGPAAAGPGQVTSGGGPRIIALVAASAVLHVAWNVRLKTAGDPLRAGAVGMLAASGRRSSRSALGAWLLLGRPPLPIEGVVLGVVSGTVEAIYFVLLSAAYRRGDLSVVYPIARGTAPLLAVAIGITVFGRAARRRGMARRRGAHRRVPRPAAAVAGPAWSARTARVGRPGGRCSRWRPA